MSVFKQRASGSFSWKHDAEVPVAATSMCASSKARRALLRIGQEGSGEAISSLGPKPSRMASDVLDLGRTGVQISSQGPDLISVR